MANVVAGYHMYAVMSWLLKNPESTAYEVARGLELGDAWRVYRMLLSAEELKAITCHRKDGDLAMRWKVVV
jgi:hypothetical protein